MTKAQQARLAEAALHAFVAVDPVSRDLVEQIKRVARADSTVLITGESGTGKDLVASLIHYLGDRPDQPLVKIDCAGLPHELVESELFGYERGAFTGATQSKRGRLELAEQGTLVLDEVSALTPAIQAKLLRVIEDRSLHRLGGTKLIQVAARIIALTNADLAVAVADRSFREDLFYRLNVVPLHVRPLRERLQDIAPLVQHFLNQLEERQPRGLRLAAGAVAPLMSHPFTGNVRELRNLVERAALSALGGVVTASSFPAIVANGAQEPAAKLSLAEMERRYIAEILDHTRGKKSKAADILGISRKNLLEKRKRYKLD